MVDPAVLVVFDLFLLLVFCVVLFCRIYPNLDIQPVGFRDTIIFLVRLCIVAPVGSIIFLLYYIFKSKDTETDQSSDNLYIAGELFSIGGALFIGLIAVASLSMRRNPDQPAVGIPGLVLRVLAGVGVFTTGSYLLICYSKDAPTALNFCVIGALCMCFTTLVLPWMRRGPPRAGLNND